MLILPPGHAAAPPGLRPLARRERRLIAGIGVLATALAVVVLVALLTGGRTSAHGCVDLKLPYSTGGAELYSCGARARAACAGASRLPPAAGAAVAAECRRAGVAVG